MTQLKSGLKLNLEAQSKTQQASWKFPLFNFLVIIALIILHDYLFHFVALPNMGFLGVRPL